MTVNEANGKSSKSTQLTHSAMRFYILDAYLTARERCYTNNNLNKDVQLIAFFFYGLYKRYTDRYLTRIL